MPSRLGHDKNRRCARTDAIADLGNPSAADRDGPHRRPPPRGKFRGGFPPDGPAILYGIHTVKAALENPARRIRKLFVTENALRRLREDGAPIAIEPEMVRPDVLAARLGPEAVHQGVLAEADPLPSPDDRRPAGAGRRAGARPDHRSA